MIKRINVSGDIESRQRIAQRHVSPAAQQTIIRKQDEKEKEHEADPVHPADSTPKTRRRKTGGNP